MWCKTEITIINVCIYTHCNLCLFYLDRVVDIIDIYIYDIY